MNTFVLKQVVSSAKKAWRGEERLLVAFWGWFICPLILLMGLHILTQPIVHLLINPVAPEYLYSLYILDTVLSIVPRILLALIIWRCARNIDRHIWFYIARTMSALYIFLLVGGAVLQFAKVSSEKRSLNISAATKTGIQNERYDH